VPTLDSLRDRDADFAAAVVGAAPAGTHLLVPNAAVAALAQSLPGLEAVPRLEASEAIPSDAVMAHPLLQWLALGAASRGANHPGFNLCLAEAVNVLPQELGAAWVRRQLLAHPTVEVSYAAAAEAGAGAGGAGGVAGEGCLPAAQEPTGFLTPDQLLARHASRSGDGGPSAAASGAPPAPALDGVTPLSARLLASPASPFLSQLVPGGLLADLTDGGSKRLASAAAASAAMWQVGGAGSYYDTGRLDMNAAPGLMHLLGRFDAGTLAANSNAGGRGAMAALLHLWLPYVVRLHGANPDDHRLPFKTMNALNPEAATSALASAAAAAALAAEGAAASPAGAAAAAPAAAAAAKDRAAAAHPTCSVLSADPKDVRSAATDLAPVGSRFLGFESRGSGAAADAFSVGGKAAAYFHRVWADPDRVLAERPHIAASLMTQADVPQYGAASDANYWGDRLTRSWLALYCRRRTVQAIETLALERVPISEPEASAAAGEGTTADGAGASAAGSAPAGATAVQSPSSATTFFAHLAARYAARAGALAACPGVAFAELEYAADEKDAAGRVRPLSVATPLPSLGAQRLPSVTVPGYHALDPRAPASLVHLCPPPRELRLSEAGDTVMAFRVEGAGLRTANGVYCYDAPATELMRATLGGAPVFTRRLGGLTLALARFPMRADAGGGTRWFLTAPHRLNAYEPSYQVPAASVYAAHDHDLYDWTQKNQPWPSPPPPPPLPAPAAAAAEKEAVADAGVTAIGAGAVAPQGRAPPPRKPAASLQWESLGTSCQCRYQASIRGTRFLRDKAPAPSAITQVSGIPLELVRAAATQATAAAAVAAAAARTGAGAAAGGSGAGAAAAAPGSGAAAAGAAGQPAPMSVDQLFGRPVGTNTTALPPAAQRAGAPLPGAGPGVRSAAAAAGIATGPGSGGLNTAAFDIRMPGLGPATGSSGAPAAGAAPAPAAAAGNLTSPLLDAPASNGTEDARNGGANGGPSGGRTAEWERLFPGSAGASNAATAATGAPAPAAGPRPPRPSDAGEGREDGETDADVDRMSPPFPQQPRAQPRSGVPGGVFGGVDDYGPAEGADGDSDLDALDGDDDTEDGDGHSDTYADYLAQESDDAALAIAIAQSTGDEEALKVAQERLRSAQGAPARNPQRLVHPAGTRAAPAPSPAPSPATGTARPLPGDRGATPLSPLPPRHTLADYPGLETLLGTCKLLPVGHPVSAAVGAIMRPPGTLGWYLQVLARLQLSLPTALKPRIEAEIARAEVRHALCREDVAAMLSRHRSAEEALAHDPMRREGVDMLHDMLQGVLRGVLEEQHARRDREPTGVTHAPAPALPASGAGSGAVRMPLRKTPPPAGSGFGAPGGASVAAGGAPAARDAAHASAQEWMARTYGSGVAGGAPASRPGVGFDAESRSQGPLGADNPRRGLDFGYDDEEDEDEEDEDDEETGLAGRGLRARGGGGSSGSGYEQDSDEDDAADQREYNALRVPAVHKTRLGGRGDAPATGATGVSHPPPLVRRPGTDGAQEMLPPRDPISGVRALGTTPGTGAAPLGSSSTVGDAPRGTGGGPPAPLTTAQAESVALLEAMGFSAADALDALRTCHWDVEIASNLLLEAAGNY
jgi:hypothetical protein